MTHRRPTAHPLTTAGLMLSMLLAALLTLITVLPGAAPTGTAYASGPDRAACLNAPNGPGCTAGLPSVEYQMLLDEMLLHPHPDVRPISPNIDELAKYAFRRIVGGAATIYDAPGGNPIGGIDEGFTYVTVNAVQGDWIQINDRQWMPASQLAVARPSYFTGVHLDKPLTYPMAWILVSTNPSPYPGALGDANQPLLERYTRVNIFATATVGGWEWYLIGPEQWVRQTSVARILPVDVPSEVKGRWFSIDLYEQVLVAYEGDSPVFATLVSSGLEDWETNEGLFNVGLRQSSGHMSGAEGQVDFYSLENVPWVMYYDGAISMHGTYWHDGFGYRHSHGCVNLSITDAHWVFNWSADGGYDEPYVYVWSSGEYR